MTAGHNATHSVIKKVAHLEHLLVGILRILYAMYNRPGVISLSWHDWLMLYGIDPAHVPDI